MKSSRLYLEESSLFLLLSENKRREDLSNILKAHLQNQCCLCTSAFTFQILMETWEKLALGAVNQRKLSSFINDLEELFEIILPVGYSDLKRSFQLQKTYSLSPNQAIHTSIVYGYDIEIMLAPHKPYGSVPFLEFIPLSIDS